MDSSAVPKVSVIIPLYNKAPYIKRALDSVFAQTVQDFEIVVVGGNSTDGGEDIVHGYSNPRIRFVKEAGKGVSAARNQGVDAAQAELVAFLDADDEWLPEFLETILRLRDKWPDAGMYSTAWYNCFKDGRITASKCYEIPDNWEGIIPSVFRCAAMDGVFPGYTSSIVIPKEIFIRTGGFREDSNMGEDLDLWGRIALNHTNAHSSRPMVKYMHDDENAATKNSSLILQEEYPFQKSVSELTANGYNADLPYDVLLYLNSLNIGLAWNMISLGEMQKARYFLKLVIYPELKKRKQMATVRTYLPEYFLPLARRIKKMIDSCFRE